MVTMRPLTRLVHLQAILERGRISADNQRRGIEDEEIAMVYASVFDTLKGLEDDVERMMAQRVKQHPTWDWLEKVKGIGPQSASLALAYLLPPIPDKGPSSWYKAAGLGVMQTEGGESRLMRPSHWDEMKAQGLLKQDEEGRDRLPYHPRLRRNLYVLGTSLLRAGGYYYKHYIEMKAALALKHPDWKGRSHAVAFWKMVKLFLSHLWEVWCKAENIETRGPYPMEILGHRKIEVPWNGG